MAEVDKGQKPEGQPPKGKAGRPKKGDNRQITNVSKFFVTVKKIPPSAWTDDKALIKVYRREPTIDRIASGKAKHIQEYHEPIESEERIKSDHGSGKYLLFLQFQGAKDEGLREVERADIDILDMNFPPKVPEGEWLDEPKNAGWRWAFPNHGKQEQRASATSELVQAMEAVSEIQDRAIERAKPAEPEKRESTLDIIKGVKEMMTPPAPATENKILDTVLALMMKQVDSAAADNKELRKEIADMRAKPATENKGFWDALPENVNKLKAVIPEIKNLFGNAAEGVGLAVGGRSRMSGWQEMLQPVMPEIAKALAPALPALVLRIFAPIPPGVPAIAANPAAPQAPQQAHQALDQMLTTITPAVINYLNVDADGDELGEEFASWVREGYGPQAQMFARQVGAAGLIEWYRKSPYWVTLQPVELKLQAFIQAFLAWEPEPEGNEAKPEDGEPQTIEPDRRTRGERLISCRTTEPPAS